jgi:hypothetical protein
MPPEAVIAVIDGIEELISLEPKLAADIKALFTSGNPTDADFDALRARVTSRSYGNLVPNTDLPPDVANS